MQKNPGFSGFNPSGLFWVIAPATGLSGGPAGAGGVATVLRWKSHPHVNHTQLRSFHVTCESHVNHM